MYIPQEHRYSYVYLVYQVPGMLCSYTCSSCWESEHSSVEQQQQRFKFQTHHINRTQHSSSYKQLLQVRQNQTPLKGRERGIPKQLTPSRKNSRNTLNPPVLRSRNSRLITPAPGPLGAENALSPLADSPDPEDDADMAQQALLPRLLLLLLLWLRVCRATRPRVLPSLVASLAKMPLALSKASGRRVVVVGARAWWWCCWVADRTCEPPLEATNALQEVAVDETTSNPVGTLRRHPAHRDRDAAFALIDVLATSGDKLLLVAASGCY